jgi:hypothetical protein
MLYVPSTEIDKRDPQRSATGDPLCLAQHSPTEAGSFAYEIWPASMLARQLWVLCGLQWPELQLSTDRPPWFIDSTVFVYGAIADALRIKNIRMAADTDPYFNPQLADKYEIKYEQGVQLAINSNQAKAQTDFQVNRLPGLYGMGSTYMQSHDADLDDWGI